MRIHQIELLTADLQAQHDFYAGVLGLSVASGPPDALTIVGDQWQLGFRSAPVGWEGVYHFAFNIPENQFDAARTWLAARVSLNTGPDGSDTFFFDVWNAHAVYCTDPAGNIVELIARHTLPNASESPFTGGQLLTISELALVTDDVAATVQSLQSEMALPIYRGENSANFTAIGSDEGLLIIVRRGRPGLSDQGKPAQPSPTRATISSAGDTEQILTGPPWVLHVDREQSTALLILASPSTI